MASGDEAGLPGDARGVNATVRAQFAAQATHVVFDRFRAYMQRLGNGAVGQAVTEQHQHLTFAGAETGDALANAAAAGGGAEKRWMNASAISGESARLPSVTAVRAQARC